MSPQLWGDLTEWVWSAETTGLLYKLMHQLHTKILGYKKQKKLILKDTQQQTRPSPDYILLKVNGPNALLQNVRVWTRY